MMLRNPWFGFGMNAWSLGIDASSVIALRTLKIAAGGAAAEVEACRMVSEKIETVLALQALALTGGLGLTASSVELSPNLGDGLRDQAAAVWDCEDAGLAATSIPSVNLTP
jgi:hypothetical protein